MSSDQIPMDNPFTEHGRTLRRRKWWIAGTTVIVAAAALGYSLTEAKQYTATTSLQVLASTQVTPAGNQSPQTLSQEAQTDAALLTTPPVKQAVAAALHLRLPPPVSTTVSSTSNLLIVAASGPTPTLAETYADMYATQFIKLQKQRALQNYVAQSSAINNEIGSDEAAQIPLNKILAHIPTNPKTGAPDPTLAQATALTSRDGLQRDVSTLKEQLTTLTANSTLATGGVEVAAPAIKPKAPSTPKTNRNVGLGIVVGLILGLVLAFVIDSFDDSIRSEADVDRSYPGLPHLGVIPMVDGWNDANRPYVVTLGTPNAVAAEAYRSLRTAIEFARLNRSVRSILVTSSMGLEGKTSTVANLGVAFAGSGQNTLVVSADLRRPRLGRFFDRSEDIGLTSLALGTATIEEAIQPIEDVPGLHFLGTGPLPAGAAEFLSSPKLEAIIRDLRDQFDIVIIDAPPVLPVTDAVVMSRYLDGVLVVVAQNRTRRRGLARVHALLTQVNAQVIGSIINGAAVRGADAYGYYYGKYGSYTYDAKGSGGGKGGKRRDRKRSGSDASRRRTASGGAASGTETDAERERRTGT